MANWVSSYVGIPFLDNGRTRSGLDCYGLVRLVMQEQANILLPSYAEGYSDRDDTARIGGLLRAATEDDTWTKVPIGNERTFDVAEIYLPCIGHSLEPLHVAIVTTPGHLLDADPVHGVCVRRYQRTGGMLRQFWRHQCLTN